LLTATVLGRFTGQAAAALVSHQTDTGAAHRC
jgi:hypothetical protein